MTFQDRTPITKIRQEQQEADKAKIARLESELAAEGGQADYHGSYSAGV